MSSTKRPHSPEPSSSSSAASTEPPIHFSQTTIEDRSSVFKAAFLPLADTKPSNSSGSSASHKLQALPAFADATHKIAAWRSRGAQKTISGVGVLDLGHDDDGERSGGKTLERLLDRERIEGAVCVARWYGGVMLGPVRFDWIRDAAKDAIAVWRGETEGVKKKRRRLEDAEELQTKAELVGVLKERDQSILVLRKMLAEKSEAGASSGARPGRAPDYAKIDLGILRKLERARDSTIAVLLKKLDEAENKDAGKESPKPDSADDQASH